MVDLVAYEQVTVNHLMELGVLADTGPGSVKNKSASGFEVVQGPVHFIVGGHGISYLMGFPWEGHITSLLVTVGGENAYKFFNFDLAVGTAFNYLSDSPQAAVVQILQGNDNVTGSALADSLFAYKGNDVVHGGAGDDFINGADGNDRLFGDAGNDRILGVGGNDCLHGGLGNDIILTGTGNDQIFFDSELNALTNIDRINDFDIAHDKMVLDRSFFAGLAGGATLDPANFHVGDAADGPEQRIIYCPSDGYLCFDPDGNGPTEAVAFGWVGAGKAIDNGHFLLVA